MSNPTTAGKRTTGEWTCGGDDVQPTTTEQEWTPEWIRKKFGRPSGILKIKQICDAHKASIAAERKKREILIPHYEAQVRTIQQLRDQLADIAKREKACCPEHVGFEEYIQNLKRELAAAQALAKRNTTGCGTCATILQGDTAALDEAIAEAVEDEKKRQDFDWGHVKREYLRLQKDNEKLAAAQQPLVEAMKVAKRHIGSKLAREQIDVALEKIGVKP